MSLWAKDLKRKIVFGGFLILLTSFVFAAGCGGSGGSGDSAAGEDTVTITGNFEDNYAQSNWFNSLLPGFLPSAHAFDPSTVSKVLAFFDNGKHVISEVTEDGNFSIDVAKGAPTGLIFIGGNDNYLGYLTLGNGMDSLPLHYNKENMATIDLETLSSSDEIVETSANVLKNKFQLSQEEQSTLGYADNLFASVVKNPDVNNNGTVDFLEGKFFRLFIMYYFNGGYFQGEDLTPTVNQTSDIWNGFKFGLRTPANWPENVYFTGPPESGYENRESADPRETYQTHTFYYSEYSEELTDPPQYPPEGKYEIDYTLDSGQGTLEFNVPDQSEASANTVLPIPTVELNTDDTINKVKWVYKAAKENAFEVRPQTLIKNIELQIAGGKERLYNSGNLPAADMEHVLEDQNLLWPNVTNITLAYDDVYGNHNVVTWVHQEVK